MSREDDGAVGGLIVFVILVVGSLLCACIWNDKVYGDWTCAFSHCVKVKP